MYLGLICAMYTGLICFQGRYLKKSVVGGARRAEGELKLQQPTEEQLMILPRVDAVAFRDPSTRGAIWRREAPCDLATAVKTTDGGEIPAVSLRLGAPGAFPAETNASVAVETLCRLGDLHSAEQKRRLYPASAEGGTFRHLMDEDAPGAREALRSFATSAVDAVGALPLGYGRDHSRFVVQAYSPALCIRGSDVTYQTPTLIDYHGAFLSFLWFYARRDRSRRTRVAPPQNLAPRPRRSASSRRLAAAPPRIVAPPVASRADPNRPPRAPCRDPTSHRFSQHA